MALERIWEDETGRRAEHRPQRPAFHGFFERLIEQQRGSFFLWVPVFLASGIAIYFSLPREPHAFVFILMLVISAPMIGLGLWGGRGVLLAAGLILAGVLIAKAHTVLLSTPTLKATTGMVYVTGEVLGVEVRPKSRLRYRLAVKNIDGIKQSAWPAIVRISAPLSQNQPGPGDLIKLKARLFPLSAPVEPGGFDFGRKLWFQAIGATGFAYRPPLVLEPQSVTGKQPIVRYIHDLRTAIGLRIQQVLPGPNGGLARALTIGERGLLPEQLTENLRIAGLAHILAISGLHMSLVAGGLFWLVRALLALSPTMAVHYPIKKWAAIAALVAATGYLILSGSAIATQRAYIMLLVMFTAVLLDRPAISMRNLAIAAVVILCMAPQSVLGPSFQMSFLAVMGLIAVYDVLNRRHAKRQWRPPVMVIAALRIVLVPIAAIALTTFVAGIMTGVPAVYHFNRIANFGILANVLALPLVSMLIMPLAIVSLVLMPFGLEPLFLWLLGQALDAVIAIAAMVSALPGASISLPDVSSWGMIALTSALLILCLAKGPARGAAILPLALAISVFTFPLERPDILVDRLGKTVAVRGEKGLLVPVSGRRGRFAVEKWLQADGDPASMGHAALREDWDCQDQDCRLHNKGKLVLFLKNEDGFKPASCKTADIVISAFPLFGACPEPDIVIDRFDLWRNGAHALYHRNGGIAVETARELQGHRPWVVHRVARKQIQAGRKELTLK